MDDRTLLREFAVQGSEAAFAELVNRHADLVYSAALRQAAGDAHLAEEISQLVFLALARKARSLSAHTVLPGWLINATRLEAAGARRRQFRRERREKIAAGMIQSTDTNPLDPAWPRIAPILDDSLGRLRPFDRDAVVLHYFKRMTYREIGDVLGLSEEAARKRVNRAVDELRACFARHDVVFPAAAIGVALSSYTVQAAPVGLALGATKLALTAASGSAVGSLTAFLETLFMTKTQTALIATVGVVLVSTPLIVQQRSLSQLREENTVLRQQTTELDALRADAERISNRLAQVATANAMPLDQQMELLQLRSEVGQLRRQTNELAALRREAEQLRTVRNPMIQNEQPGTNDVALANAVIFNPTASVTAKLTALRTLRAANARTDEVVRQMVQVYLGTQDPKLRADIFRNLSGMNTAEMKAPLLQALSSSSETSEVREEAAETLASFLGEPDVKAWMDHFAAQEPDLRVRTQALNSLEHYARVLRRSR